jgi:3-oxoacyl-[acyl-carrier protein] reductase
LLADEYDLALGYAENQERAKRIEEDLHHSSPSAEVRLFGARLCSYGAAAALVDEVKKQFGRAPDVLVNSIGGTYDSLFLHSDFAAHQHVLEEHLMVTMALCHLLVNNMYRTRFGRIVNISSISAAYARRGQCSYAAAKAGIDAFSRTLALEVAHRGVTVNVVAPGLIETDLTATLIQSLRADPRGVRGKIPVGEVGKPEDIAYLVRFLCSEQARYITGVTYTVDGGRSLGDPSS